MSCFPRKTNKPSGCMRPRSILNNGLGLSEMSTEPKGKSAGLLLRSRERPLQKTLWGRWCVDVPSPREQRASLAEVLALPRKGGSDHSLFSFLIQVLTLMWTRDVTGLALDESVPRGMCLPLPPPAPPREAQGPEYPNGVFPKLTAEARRPPQKSRLC